MFESIIPVLPEIKTALGQTIYMVSVSVVLGALLGIPVGVLLYTTRTGSIMQAQLTNNILNVIVNLIHSFPFLLLTIAIIPLTRYLVGTSIGTTAAIVPMTVSCIPFFARFAEATFIDINKGIIEAAEAMGANHFQIITRVLFSEGRSGLVNSFTLVVVNYISYSTIVGIVGGGGLGDFAIRYGFYRYEPEIMVFTTIIMILMVQITQFSGNFLAKKLDKRI